MRRLLLVLGALLWAAGFFLATFWLTFPSDTLANWIRHQVPLQLGSEWSADVESVSPWYAGVSVDGVKLYKEVRGEDGEVAPQLAAIVEEANVRLALASILRGAPYFKGRLTLTGGDVWVEVGTDMEGKGVDYTDLVVQSDAFPVGDLLAFLGTSAAVQGAAAVDIDVHAGENGMRDATGTIRIEGANLTLTDVEHPEIGPLGMDVPISNLAIQAKVEKGRATFQESRVLSDLFTLDVKGDVTFRDPIDRSNLDVEIVLSNLGPQLAMFEGFMSGAKGSDGSYHFRCDGSVSRFPDICEQGEARDRRVSRPSARPASTPSTSAGSGETDEDRARSREEIQERIRKRREEREKRRNGTGTPTPTPVADPIDEEEDEEEPIDELPPEELHEPIEELPAEEEEPVE